jgi:triacylglycerol lipase
MMRFSIDLPSLGRTLTLIAVTGTLQVACGRDDKGPAHNADALSAPVPAPTPLGPEPQGNPLRYPIVIANGLISSGDSIQPVIDALTRDGHKVYLTRVPAVHSLKTRAEALSEQVDEIFEETGAEKINFFSYSMGALDSRHLAANKSYGDKIASITTISGANRGAPAASTGYKLLKDMPTGWRDKVTAFVDMIGIKVNPLIANPELLEVAYDLSVEGAARFNETTPDVPGIYYQSYAALSTTWGRPSQKHKDACGLILGDNKVPDIMNRPLNAGLLILSPEMEFQASDGMLTVESQKWGEFRGCVPTDHWGIFGSERAPGPDRRTGFDLVRFYRNVAYDLSARGF